MTSRLSRAIRVSWRAVLVAAVLVSVLLSLWVAGTLPWPRRTFDLKKIRASGGFGYTSKLPAPWPGFAYGSKSGILTEDGRAMTPVNENGMVRENGMGAFRVDGERVLFSTSDGSDPLKNGRKYFLQVDTVVSPSIRPAILVAGGLALLLLLRKPLIIVAARVRRSVFGHADNTPAISARTWAFAIFACALAIRAGFLWLNPEYTDEQMSIRGTPFSDARDWLGMAKSTATGRGVDSTYPGMRALYPMFLANFYTWFGDSVPLAKALQAMIGAASAALLFLILRRAMPPWPSVAAALFFAIDPRQITQVGKLMTEPFGLLLIMLSAWCLIVGGERRRVVLLFFSGAFFACSNLARPLTLFAFPIFVAIIAANAFLRDSHRWRAAVRHSAAFVLGTVICLAPWVIRERVVHGIWAISSNSSSALFAASTPEFGVWGSGVESLPAEAGIRRTVRGRYEFFQARFRENLEKYPGFYTSNVMRSFRVAAMGCTNLSPTLRAAGFAAFGILFLLAAWRGGMRAVPSATLPALAATLALACADARWTMAFTIVGAALTLWWRLFPGAVLVTCYFSGLLGSALFGNPDLQRVRLLIDWVEAGWTLAGAFAVGCATLALLLLIPLRAIPGLPTGADRECIDEPPVQWLRWAGWAFAAFLFVSTCRLVFLNAFTSPPPRPQLQFSDAERTVLLQEFASRFPVWRRIADPALMAAPRSWKRPAFVEFGAIEKEVYHFPANVGFSQWSDRFDPRPYEHTSFVFHVSGASFAGSVWTEFAGEVPASVRDKICLIIGLAKFRPAVAAYLENSVEAIAIIPAPDFKPDFARAIVAPVVPETQALLEAPIPPQ